MNLPEEIIELGGLRVTAVGDRATARAGIVLLHGFQMEPADLAPFAHSLGMPAWFLFPEAPFAAQLRGRAWWHIDAAARDAAIAKGPRDFAGQHPPGLPAARSALARLLDEVATAAENLPLVLGGFSQGGMLICDSLVRKPRQVAGVALFSASRVAYAEWPQHLAAGHVRGLRVLVSHGEHDPDLAFIAGVALKDTLGAAGAEITWIPFDQGHEIPLVVWRRFRKFVAGVTAL
jgi:phospholipase/carboxylesterase